MRGAVRRWVGASLLGAAVAAGSTLAPSLVRAPAPVGVSVLEAAPLVTPSDKPSFRPIRIAAADPANERHGVEVTDCASCASGSRVQYVGQGHVLVVHVRGVPVAGRRTLTIVYESDGARPLDVVVNGEPLAPLTLPGGGSWTTPARVDLPIDLPAGDTVIRLFHATAPAPDLDQIIIT